MRNADTQSADQRRDLTEHAIWTVRLLFAADKLFDAPAVPLPNGDCVVGRATEGRRDIEIPDDGRLSRHHATFKRRGSSLSVHDRDSHNGTKVNGIVAQKADLADGDLIRCGDSLLLVRKTPVDLDDPPLPGLIGRSVAMRRLRARLMRVAVTDATVVLLGETGSGKGAAARAIHAASGRASGPWIQFNCAAIPETLAESTLFGHVAGAFTGASQAETGLIRAANTGSLFIDEVGDLPPTLQPKLLHFLDDGTVLPVGSAREARSDARVLTATNVDLGRAVRSGAFRADLYARLAAVEIRLPPLRERREDVLDLLALHLEHSDRLTADLAEALVLHDWPFNVREVQQIATHLEVEGSDLSVWRRALVSERLALLSPEAEEGGSAARVTPSQEVLEELMIRHKGVVARVARELGRSTKQVYRWMSRHGMDPTNYRE